MHIFTDMNFMLLLGNTCIGMLWIYLVLLGESCFKVLPTNSEDFMALFT